MEYIHIIMKIFGKFVGENVGAEIGDPKWVTENVVFEIYELKVGPEMMHTIRGPKMGQPKWRPKMGEPKRGTQNVGAKKGDPKCGSQKGEP